MKLSLSLHEKSNGRTVALFLLLSCLGMLWMFRQAIWGQAILAPLDIGATLYSKYKWIDPSLGNVPKNHYLIDMFDYDLPRSYLVHRALAQGEFPWWEPYSEGGRPLIAESHFGPSDPLRLALFRVLPFVAAYNWVRILQSFLAGLSMFLLLRCLGFSQFTTVFGALSFQFCPSQAAFYYVVPAHSLFYYPLLWLVLHRYARSRPPLALALGGLLSAAIIMAGTQQSHVYLVLFLGCFVLGYGRGSRIEIITLLAVTGGVFAIGIAVASPILLPQLELFALCNRRVPVGTNGKELLTGVFSLAGVFPWFTGSFRTLDLGKLLNQTSAAYVVHIGTPATILAFIGLLAGRKTSTSGRPEFRMAALLAITYFLVICSTPLLRTLYLRASALAVPGLIVLCAIGLEHLSAGTWPPAARVLRWILLFLFGGIVLTHVFAFAVYPRVKERVAHFVLQKETQNPAMPSAPEVRRAQVDRLPDEITFKNPEPLLAFLGALALLGLLPGATRYSGIFAGGMFALSLLPLLLFAHRALPYSDIRYWTAMLKGGPEQQAIVGQVTGANLRLQERIAERLDRAFPGTILYLHAVHALHGYSSLSLAGKGQSLAPRDANVLYTSDAKAATGHISVLHTNQLRYIWANGQGRNVSIAKETLNSIELRIDTGPSAELVRTDTYYPGWRVESPKALALRRNADGFFTCVIPPEATTLVLRYEPSHHQLSRLICAVSLVGVGALFVAGIRRRQAPVAEQM